MFGFDDPFGTKKQNNTGRDPQRSFNATQRKEILYQQNSKCAVCHKQLDPRDIEYDHKKPWCEKGRTKVVNGRAVCGSCHNIITHDHKLKKKEPSSAKKSAAKKPSTKKPTANRRKASSNPFDVSLPSMELPKMKMPKGKGGFGLF